MKIYILRHEKRYPSTDFDTNLNEDGKKDAEFLKYSLENLKLDIIYCSPYKRIIQTIEPYLKSSGKKVRIDNSIYESLMRNTNHNNLRDSKIDNLYGEEYHDKDYTSFLNVSSLKLGETYHDMIERTSNFIKNIINLYQNTNKKILIVSHMTTINSLLNRDPYDHYQQGKVIKIFDSDLNNRSCLSVFKNCISYPLNDDNISRWYITNPSACFIKIN
jgi:2,3-bisphosphoglycerate-dependent phosphoglycerate mutase